MLIIYFIIASLFVMLFASGVAIFAEKIESSITTKSAFIGMLLLALATSLPELTTAVITAVQHKPELLFANVLGSNFFNLIIIALLQIVFWRKNPLDQIPRSYLFSYILMLLMHAIVFFGLGIIHVTTIFTFLPSLVLIVLYFLTIKFSPGSPSNEAQEKQNLWTAFGGFILLSVALVFAAITLINLVDELSIVYQLSTLFAGSILIGVVTSLPELVSSIALLRRNQFTLFVEAIIGSNILNLFMLVIGDVLMGGKSVFDIQSAGSFMTYLSLLILASIFLLFGMFFKERSKFASKLPFLSSVLIFVTYLFTFF